MPNPIETVTTETTTDAATDAAASKAAAAKLAAKRVRVAAKKELKQMHAVNDKGPKSGFDAKRYHELHYLAAGKPIPERDDLD